jgi:GNAT superfamily N-acetyltransferase
MKSSFAMYIEEREGKFIVEDERGFATYQFLKDCIYVEDVYVRPEYRMVGVASTYVEAIEVIARERGLKRIITTVSPRAKNCTNSLKAVLAYGFILESSDSDAIYFSKETV